MRTLGQTRAEFALQEVFNALANENNAFKKEFKSYTAGVPSMILMNGFGQTLAFMAGKNEKKHRIVFDIVKNWLTNHFFNLHANNAQMFLMSLSTMDQKDYLAAQKETLALLEWVKRFAAMEAL